MYLNIISVNGLVQLLEHLFIPRVVHSFTTAFIFPAQISLVALGFIFIFWIS